MPDKYQNIYRIPSARLRAWDYSSNGPYSITICTANREHYFGEITKGKMGLSDQGRIANQYWLEIPHHFSSAFLDEHVIMPNHIQGIIIIDKTGNPDFDNAFGDVVETGHALSLQTKRSDQTDNSEPHKPSHPRFRNQGKGTISAMVGTFKSAVTKYCNKHKLPFAWQTRFHDHIIRDSDEFHRTRYYIINNPSNWEQDEFF